MREQFRNMPDEFMTSTVAATSKVGLIRCFELTICMSSDFVNKH